MKISSLGAELLRADKQAGGRADTDRHDEANSRFFFQFGVRA